MRSSLTLVAAVVLGVAAVSAAVAEHQEGSPKAAAAGPEPADSAAKADEPRAEFKPSTRKALFVEQFLDDWDKRWSPSEATKKSGGEDSGNDPDLWRYRGRWAVEEATVYPGLKHDRGLVLKTAAAFHAISAPFAAPIDPAGKDLVVQYEVKMQQGLECGGAYLKLLQANDAKSFQAKDFTNETPYTLMFGPDKCGSTNKVHFIFHHKNPITGESEEKQLESPPFARTDKLSTLYTLIVRPDNTYEIRVNDDKVSSGSLLENFKPPVNPPKEVVDSNDTKPADWVDEAKIPDPDAKKPDDWDEDEPFEILDVDAKKPDDWYEDETETIPDPDAVKPHDWNDEEDGEWVPPTILNPKCEKAAGCGKWSTPMKRNPLYKGKWKPPMIDNPAYKGVWKPRMIPNPGYFEDRNPANLSKMSGIGFELWTMQPDIMFDNIFIGHDIAEAQAFAEETWKVKYNIEKADEKKALGENMKTPERAEQTPAVKFTENSIEYLENNVFSIVSKIVGLPMEDLKAQRRYILVGAVSMAALITTLVYTVLSNMLASRRVAGEGQKSDAISVDEEENENEEEEQREADAAVAGEMSAEAAAATNTKANVVKDDDDATEAAVKKMEVHAGGPRKSSATLKNRASTAAAASADKSADKE